MSMIYLSGFMGAGKTTIAGPLAEALQLPCLDLDKEIEARLKTTIPAIFEAEGEMAFRRHEYAILQQLPRPAVVSLGGGAPVNPLMGDYLLKTGTLIFIEWPIEVLLLRIKGDSNRPLASDETSLRARYESRLPTYRKAHHHWCSQPPHQETVDQIVAWILERLHSSQA